MSGAAAAAAAAAARCSAPSGAAVPGQTVFSGRPSCRAPLRPAARPATSRGVLTRTPSCPRPACLPACSKKEAEVVSLRHQLAERDGKLKAARADALEARMALQQKDAELKAAFAQLSETVHERSVMRTQLAQVRRCGRRGRALACVVNRGACGVCGRDRGGSLWRCQSGGCSPRPAAGSRASLLPVAESLRSMGRVSALPAPTV